MGNSKLARFLLRHAPQRIGSDKLDVVATAILLLNNIDLDVLGTALRGLEHQKFKLDAKLVSDFYAECPDKLKVDLARSVVVFRLEPKDFSPIFRDAYKRAVSATQRRDLAHSLHYVLRTHPEEVPKYRNFVLDFMRSSEREVCMVGVGMAGLINDLRQDDLEFLRSKISARFFGQRMNVLNAFAELFRRYKIIDPKVLEFCNSQEVIGAIQRVRREDRDKYVRICAEYCLYAYVRMPRSIRTQPVKPRPRPRLPRGTRPPR